MGQALDATSRRAAFRCAGVAASRRMQDGGQHFIRSVHARDVRL
jgi:hypothetical protein